MIWLQIVGYACFLIGGLNTLWFGMWWATLGTAEFTGKFQNTEKMKRNLDKVKGYTENARERFFIALGITIVGCVITLFV